MSVHVCIIISQDAAAGHGSFEIFTLASQPVSGVDTTSFVCGLAEEGRTVNIIIAEMAPQLLCL